MADPATAVSSATEQQLQWGIIFSRTSGNSDVNNNNRANNKIGGISIVMIIGDGGNNDQCRFSPAFPLPYRPVVL